MYLGAGKTTLLNYLSDKDPSKNLNKQGDVFINGVSRSKIDYGRYVAYVQQEDVLFQTLTVRECLEFAGRMRLPPSVDYKARVDQLIESLKLEKAQNTKIGGNLVRGVSGGERKRTSIGVELITDPSLIFLDEPTTGLDSFTAFNVVEVLRAIAQSGRTVVSTIHQPNTETFDQFDQLMLLADGRTIYMNDASKAVNYFARTGYPCPEHTNPADHFMYMMSIEAYELDAEEGEMLAKRRTEVEQSYKQKIDSMQNNYENSEMKCDPDSEHPEARPINKVDENAYKAGFFKQYCLLLQRGFKNILRLPLTSYFKLISIFFVALLVVLIYGQLGNDARSIQSRNGVLYFITIGAVMNQAQGVGKFIIKMSNGF